MQSKSEGEFNKYLIFETFENIYCLSLTILTISHMHICICIEQLREAAKKSSTNGQAIRGGGGKGWAIKE